MTNTTETLKISRITNEDIRKANAKIDFDSLGEVESGFWAAFKVKVLIILFELGLKKDEKERKEVYRKRKVMDRRKKINIRLDPAEVSRLWAKVYRENRFAAND